VGVLQFGTRVEVLSLILLCHAFSTVLIPPSLERSPYGGALLSTYMARATTARMPWGNAGLRIKCSLALLYHLNFIVGLAEWVFPTWYPSQNVSSLSPGHTYSAACNYSCIEKFIQWGSHNTYQWRWSPN
jgi:hypothetical protein